MIKGSSQILSFCAIVAYPAMALGSTPDFASEIRPLLADRCFACHGPDEESRQGGLRLDVQESAFGTADSGSQPLVPGSIAQSEIIARITAEDPELRMPPPDSQKTLTTEDITILKEWIEQGAPWDEHWSLVPPTQPSVPATSDDSWCATAIDRFLLRRMEEHRLQPSPKADKAARLRRVTLDLIGLPPTPAERDAFLADDSASAYERVVGRLLDSPHYGEHMARFWLDAARYGDTHGLHLDNYREMWLYRDWVIDAFNRNIPFDQFATEQLAGDLYPNATRDQRIASGFNRCHVTTHEGGSIEEEVYVRNVVDRVATFGTVFLGLTLDCTRCHDHKYDPLTMRDFYSLFAYFNNLDASPLDGNAHDHPPVEQVFSPAAQNELAELKRRACTIQAEIELQLAQLKTRFGPEDWGHEQRSSMGSFQQIWFDDSLPAAGRDGDWTLSSCPPVFSGSSTISLSAEGTKQNVVRDAVPYVIAEEDHFFAHVYLDPANPPKALMLQWYADNWEHRAYWGDDRIAFGVNDTPSRHHMGNLPPAGVWVRLAVPAADVGLAAGQSINGWALTQFDGTVYWDHIGVCSRANHTLSRQSLGPWLIYQKLTAGAGLSSEAKAAWEIAPPARSSDQTQLLEREFVRRAFHETRDFFAPLDDKLTAIKQCRDAITDDAPTTLIFKEREDAREAYILKRGEYDQRGDRVDRAVPAALPLFETGSPTSRLELARWLFHPRHPLTARVTVNRIWQQLFGTGIVETSEDFGSQGTPPSHPELLDWLATQLIADDWDLKKTVKRIVLSSAYQQSAVTIAQALARDPENRWLARSPRYRLDAEVIRDQALAVGGLLVPEIGGPSVKPPQPDGLWFAVGYSGSNTVRFEPDHGHDKVHRRTLYTFIKRTAPPPQMSTLDAPCRESCTVRRERTNTPLQALLLLNDPQFVECARGLASQVMEAVSGDSMQDAVQRAQTLWWRCTLRDPAGAEIEALCGLVDRAHRRFQQDPEAAKQLVGLGVAPPDSGADPAELAAWTIAANVVLNLDEVISKP